MKRAVLRLVLDAYVRCLERRMPPSGRPLLHDLTADVNTLIAALPSGGGPDIGELEHLDTAKVEVCLEWLFTSIAAAHSDSWVWKLSAHLGRLLALEMVDEILAGVVTQPHSLGAHPPEDPATATAS